ncbi:Beta-lactamase [Paenibacillus sp. UNC496MF]|uniref:serine hydrolase domain-containing protein n=1 Tax=Paenibacillus sp. UNC496MF TaxID=1502753 RepID=UPI0008E9193E|nr:serine hydrolase domain-containing protein [Paenibacillus sp. UNC496MF]SFJ03726.1 Beta-lactamase [Paenibacillus sp. UNC496MF]
MRHDAQRSPAGAFRRLDAYMAEARERLSTGSALCVVRGDDVVHEAYGGRHGAEPGSRPIDAVSQFHLASVRKTYLGFAVSLAIEEGRIASLDDAAADYLEDAGEVPLAGITLRHLLTHTHGLRRGGEAGREFPPGTGWSYNNTELGPSLPAGAFQSLGVYGCAVLVLPLHGAAAVRMLNGFKPNPPGYDYLADIRRFGDLVLEALECASMKG